ncbi:MAG: NUDIX hydrolase [Pirellulales bacterium]|nr:NUDIX hydrolase [Pirellulales bacterium]
MSDQPELLLQARRFHVVRISRQLADGTTCTHDVVMHPGAVVILPMIDADHVCLIRNYRMAVGETLLELPAGTLEPDEDPAATARRELIEETGHRADRIEKLCEFYMSPGVLNEKMYLFVATGLHAGKTALEVGEEIEAVVVSWDEAMRLVVAGEIRDAKSLVGLLLYDRLRPIAF